MKWINKVLILLFATAFMFTSQAYSGDEWWKNITDQLNTKDEAKDGDLTTTEMGDAFKQALKIGSENVVEQLGGVDGFNADAAIRIPLPKELETVKAMLGKVGMSAMVDDLELKLNRAAEAATPKAKALFVQSISELASVGAIQAYDSVMGNYQTMPFVPDVKADLTQHVVDKGMEGIFYYIAKEEAAIRQDPMKQTTALLQKVFGGN